MSVLEERIRRGLAADVTVSADELITAAAAGAQRARRQQRWVVATGTAAAVLTVIVGVLAVTRGNDTAAPPVAPSPPPPPSVTYESPGPGDHPISLYDGAGAPILVTAERLDRAGTATLWRKESGGWQRVGTLEDAVPPDPRYYPYSTYLSPGPGSQDVVAHHLARRGVGFSHDGGATWSYLTQPPDCPAGAGCSAVAPTSDHLYLNNHDTAMRAAFGATTWTEIAVPRPASGVIPLEDALLSVDLDCDNATNHYWVSRDDGDTWSGRRDYPAGTCIVGSTDNTAYAADAEETQWWRSTDLVHWEHAPSSPSFELARQAYAACPGLLVEDPVTRDDEPPVRVGDEVYRLFPVSNRDDRRLELRVSHDDCHTWEPALR